MMPLYEYECRDGHTTVFLSTIEDRPDKVSCAGCDATAKRIISAPVIHGITEEYADENLADPRDGKPFVVTSAAKKRQRMKDLGLVQKEPTYESRQRQRTGKLTFASR